MKEYKTVVTLEFTWEDGAQGMITKEFVHHATGDKIVLDGVKDNANEYKELFVASEPQVTSARVGSIKVLKEIYSE